jgi:diphosphomevalonate decarboxylase
LEIMQEVVKWRRTGIQAAYTLDAGPNVHAICTKGNSSQVSLLLEGIPGVKQVLSSGVGFGVKILP